MHTTISLIPLQPDDREQFIRDNQDAFNYGAMEEFDLHDNHIEEGGEIISQATIEESIDNGIAYRIMMDGQPVGGLILKIEGDYGELEILFVSPHAHSKGIGYAAWCAVEKLYPQVKVWQTVTPYFEKRNIHFYVNRCGFHIVEFYNAHHPDPHDSDASHDEQFPDGMFRFEKHIP
jgi:GNAT superfamily N-acetyltransferase